jgi:hypothetical protein
MEYFVYPYTQNSKSAKALAEALGGKRVLLTGSKYKFSEDHVLINWGSGDCPHKEALNHNIMDVIDKVRFFKRLKGTGLTPDFSTTAEGAKKLGYPVFCRTIVQGHDGKGIRIADCDGQIVTMLRCTSRASTRRPSTASTSAGGLTARIVIIGGARKVKLPITAEYDERPDGHAHLDRRDDGVRRLLS